MALCTEALSFDFGTSKGKEWIDFKMPMSLNIILFRYQHFQVIRVAWVDEYPFSNFLMVRFFNDDLTLIAPCPKIFRNPLSLSIDCVTRLYQKSFYSPLRFSKTFFLPLTLTGINRFLL